MENTHLVLSRWVAASLLLVCTVLKSDGGDTLFVHACVDDTNQAVRIVDANTNCNAGESSLHWAIQGPPGPTDPVLLGRITTLETQVSTLQSQVASLLGFHVVPVVSLTGNVALNEGTQSNTTFPFTVSLDMPSSDTVTANFATMDGTAVAGIDYTARSGQLVFLPGETSSIVNVTVLANSVPEIDKTFTIELSNVINATVGNTSATGSILNDDTSTLAFTGPAGSLIEGDTFAYDLTLSGPSTFVISVDYSLASGTAVVGVDLADMSGTITFNPGETSAQILVDTFDDSEFEPDEDFSINLTNPVNTQLSTNQITSTIQDNEVSLLSIQPGNVVEGNSGKSPFTILNMTVTLTPPSLSQITVKYGRTAGGTASNIGFFNQNGDIQVVGPFTTCNPDSTNPNAMAGCPTVTFNPGESQKNIAIQVNGDTSIEGDENFFIKLFNSSGGGVAIFADTAEGTITDDDF